MSVQIKPTTEPAPSFFYDFVDENFELKRAITIQDFERDFQNWSSR
jgi:hypothetical protein